MPKVQTCPHCYMTVVIKADGVCPSCGKNALDLSGANLELGEVVIRDTQAMPALCMVCGAPATHRCRVVRSRDASECIDPSRQLANIFVFGLFLGAIFSAWERSNTRRMILRLPACKAHRNDRLFVPLNVNFEQSQMTFVAHRLFRESLRAKFGS